MKKTESRFKLIKQPVQDIKIQHEYMQASWIWTLKIFENFRIAKSLLVEIFPIYIRNPFW